MLETPYPNQQCSLLLPPARRASLDTDALAWQLLDLGSLESKEPSMRERKKQPHTVISRIILETAS